MSVDLGDREVDFVAERRSGTRARRAVVVYWWSWCLSARCETHYTASWLDKRGPTLGMAKTGWVRFGFARHHRTKPAR